MCHNITGTPHGSLSLIQKYDPVIGTSWKEYEMFCDTQWVHEPLLHKVEIPQFCTFDISALVLWFWNNLLI